MIGNLMSLALGVVGSQCVTWERFKSRTTNSVGHQVPTYYDAREIHGQVQPVPVKMYEALGLDFNKRYVTLYTPAGVVAVARDGTGDRITYAGDTYVAESDTPWSAQAGWTAVVCVKVPA